MSLEDHLDKFDRTFNVLRFAVRRAVTHAYEEGYQAGAEAMRDSIMRAAQTPLVTSSTLRSVHFSESHKSDDALACSEDRSGGHISEGSTSPLKEDDATNATASSRLRRGTVRRFLVGSALQGHRGMTIKSLQQAAELSGIELSPEAIGNELRRNEGRLYRREDNGFWFLISEGDSASEDGEEEAVDDPGKEHSTASAHQSHLTKEAHMEPP